MTDYVQLSRPPLREAVISLQLSEDLVEGLILNFKDKKLGDYEVVKPTRRGQFRFQIYAEMPAQASITRDEVDGWRYESKDGSRVVQLRRTGMTYSVLRGYTNWVDFKTSAFNLWQQFCEEAGSVIVGRLAVRYINVLQIPMGADFDEYLAAGPRIPAGVPQLLNGFFHRVEIPFAEARAIAIVTQVLEPPNQVNIPVVLDIDVQSPGQYEGHTPEIWTHLDKLREVKNMIFFSSLTKRALELCQ